MSDEELEVLITLDDRMVRRALRYGSRNGGKEIQIKAYQIANNNA